MPTDQTKTPSQILELPPGLTLDQLQTLLNDRIQSINDALKLYVQNPATSDVDLGSQRIINLADPKDDLDGVNLRSLRKFAGTGGQQTVAGSGSSGPYCLYLMFDGFPDDGQTSPIATINRLRDGRAPVIMSMTATLAGSSDVHGKLIVDGANLLTEDLVLPAGQLGPVYSSKFALTAALRIGQGVQAIVVQSGGAAQVTMELALG